MFGLLILLFTLIPALEIYLLIQVGGVIGGLNTILIVVVTGIVGATLAKAQGLAVLYKIQNDLSQGQIPTDQILHGLLVFGGGLLLLTPGFITDILGFSMVIPGTRHLIATALKQYFQNGIKNGNIRFTNFGQGQSGFKSYTFYSSSQSPFEESTNTEFISDENVIEAEFKEK